MEQILLNISIKFPKPNTILDVKGKSNFGEKLGDYISAQKFTNYNLKKIRFYFCFYYT